MNNRSVQYFPTRRSSDLGWIDRYLLPVLVLELEPNHAVDQGEQGVVIGPAHVLAGVELGASLPDDDVAGDHLLTTIALHAQILGVAGPPIAARAYALLVCHMRLNPASDR